MVDYAYINESKRKFHYGDKNSEFSNAGILLVYLSSTIQSQNYCGENSSFLCFLTHTVGELTCKSDGVRLPTHQIKRLSVTTPLQKRGSFGVKLQNNTGNFQPLKKKSLWFTKVFTIWWFCRNILIEKS